ncbi:LLM class flavin-dependent oxidoreductase [Brevibacterium samyangense]|uniref:Luciferase-like domain-containing protein n=1 Tax=Brevibacterium samyangense TaxID=366888 RepID=A0ABN2T2C1_9MICO
MTVPSADPTLPLAVRIPATALLDSAGFDTAGLAAAAKALDTAGVRWLVLGDDHASGPDALALAAWLAPQTENLVLVPEVPVTHSEPFHVATSTATLDHDSHGRGGWSPTVQTSGATARLIGRRPAAEAPAAWAEAVAVDEVVTALWHSWDRDAEIRDLETARFLDRDRVHYVDYTGTDSVGEEWTVKGPSIVPQPPQGDLPTLVTVDSGEAAESAIRAAAAFADIVVASSDAFRAGLTAPVVEARDSTFLVRVPVTGAGPNRAELAALVTALRTEDVTVHGVLLDVPDLGDVEAIAARVADS